VVHVGLETPVFGSRAARAISLVLATQGEKADLNLLGWTIAVELWDAEATSKLAPQQLEACISAGCV
jgi:hypothetical protein